MKSAFVHAGLLVVALLAALTTWTRDPAQAGEPAVLVWERPSLDVAAVTYRSGDRTVVLERRGEGAEAHLWGRETYPAAQPLAMAPDSGAAPAPAPLTTEEYPLEVDADTVFARLARLRAIRDLGAADDEKRETYGLAEAEPALTVRFADGSERKLLFGKSVAGGGPRYVLDEEASHVYVMSPDVMIPFEGGVGTLRLIRYLGLVADDVSAVTVKVGSTERTMQRRLVDSPPRPVWTPPDSDTPDVAFGLLMQQLVDGLWVLRYDPSVAPIAVQQILRADFVGQGRQLGWLELFKGPGADGATRYYMRTQKTVVMGEIEPGQAEKIEQDIRTNFRAAPTGQ